MTTEEYENAETLVARALTTIYLYPQRSSRTPGAVRPAGDNMEIEQPNGNLPADRLSYFHFNDIIPEDSKRVSHINW